jgi:light-harvesting complex II chlorophyll a/b binding protein 3
MALMAASSATVVKQTPFLGQRKGANPLRDVVAMGTSKVTMVFPNNLFFFSLHISFLYWCYKL